MATRPRKERNPDELTVPEAALALGLHQNTVVRWAREAATDGASRFAPGAVRWDGLSRRWYLAREEIERLRSKAGEYEY